MGLLSGLRKEVVVKEEDEEEEEEGVPARVYHRAYKSVGEDQIGFQKYKIQNDIKKQKEASAGSWVPPRTFQEARLFRKRVGYGRYCTGSGYACVCTSAADAGVDCVGGDGCGCRHI
ncbi:hypothetical protein M0804_009281 [Polistes exclamans]|nr:hypothetical protein M0804_009281 [Polistes exclamans]